MTSDALTPTIPANAQHRPPANDNLLVIHPDRLHLLMDYSEDEIPIMACGEDCCSLKLSATIVAKRSESATAKGQARHHDYFFKMP